MLLVLERPERRPSTTPLVEGREAKQRLVAVWLHFDGLWRNDTEQRRFGEDPLPQFLRLSLSEQAALLLAHRLAQRREALLQCRVLEGRDALC